MDRKVRATAVHAAPVFMNKVATVRKVVELVKKAKEDAIELLVFPETFVPGYPVSAINTRRMQLTHDHSTLSNAIRRSSRSPLFNNTPNKAL